MNVNIIPNVWSICGILTLDIRLWCTCLVFIDKYQLRSKEIRKKDPLRPIYRYRKDSIERNMKAKQRVVFKIRYRAHLLL